MNMSFKDGFKFEVGRFLAQVATLVVIGGLVFVGLLILGALLP